MLEDISKDVVLKIANYIDGDGWTIFDPMSFVDIGMTQEQIAPFCRNHESNRKVPKETIFGVDGKILDKCLGVHGLDLVYTLAIALSLPRSSKSGRGSMCREICGELRKYAKGEQS